MQSCANGLYVLRFTFSGGILLPTCDKERQ